MRKNSIRKHSSLGLALLLLFVCAVAAADMGFMFRNGVTWDSTVEEMMAAEGVRDYDANFRQNTITDQFTRYYVQSGEGVPEHAIYVYCGDEPVMMYSSLLADTKAISVYDEHAEVFTARYGEPLGYSMEDLYALMNIIWPDRFTPEDYEQVTAWRLAEGTLAALLSYRGENVMAYFHEQRITGAAEISAD